MLEQSKKLFRGWNDNNIRYFHWKSNEHLQEGLDGKTDVDIYVFPSDKERGEAVLADSGYIKFTPQQGSRYTDVDEWIGFDYDTGSLVHIHLHYAMVTGKRHVKEHILPWYELGLATRVKDEATDVFIACPDLELIILYTRMALKTPFGNKVEIKNDYAVEIEYLKRRTEPGRIREFCRSLYPVHGEEIFAIINKENPSGEELERLKTYVEGELEPYVRYSELSVFLRHYYYKNLTKFKGSLSGRWDAIFINRKTPGKPGVSICFIGADGSGKSTISNDIVKWLNWKIECRRFYLGSGDHYRSLFKTTTKAASKAVKLSKTAKNRTETPGKISNSGTVTGKGARKSTSALKKVFYAMRAQEYVRIANRAYKQLDRSDKYMKKGGIAVFDRFPQTQFGGLYDGPKIESHYGMYLDRWPFKAQAKWERRFLDKAVGYKPTIVIKLMVTPEESIRRKPDHRYSDVKEKAELTGNLKFEGSAVYNINAEQPYDKELLEVKRIIWDAISHHS